ncbi:hypothetical protein DFH08DRAFT_964855 [Mycena albidolilacea]|uniref:Uncharacterized protein n=1 Tax=Mycena albidolilacea TaxID=1033008 RepID=A0AAD6ZSL0_9AGAR|nr:hypothetical protein DFH08DRAFT_964855 [Mycena albidolilacea]
MSLGPRKYQDLHTRKDHTQLQVDVFTRQIECMADAYMYFQVAVAEEEGLPSSCAVPAPEGIQEMQYIFVMDQVTSTLPPLVCVGDGYPHPPSSPPAVITIRTLEVYHVVRLQYPQLGIQAFVQTLCNIHGVVPCHWLAAQFSVTFDIYLVIRATVDRRVQAALGHNTLHWHLKNTCPCCLYKLEGEPYLKILIMGTYDGNNSFLCFWLHERVEVDKGVFTLGTSKERVDNCVMPGDYYLMWEEADQWGKDGVEEVMKSFASSGEDGGNNDDGCSERWQNMKEDITLCAYGMYDETGFFPVLCQHSFFLKVVDMARSGELSKYLLAIVAHLLNILGEIAIGYDIGCKFGKMVKVHPALQELPCEKNLKVLVGAFHRHGHNRLCGLDNLMTYIEGVGLEALETCESFFSKSNALASTTL